MFITYEDQYLKATIAQHDGREPDVYVEWKVALASVITVEARGWRKHTGAPHVTLTASLPDDLQQTLSWLSPCKGLFLYKEAVTFTANLRLRTDQRRMDELMDIPSEQSRGRAAGLAEKLAKDITSRFEYQSRQFTQYVERAFVEGKWTGEDDDEILSALRRDADLAQKLADLAQERADLAKRQARARRSELIREYSKKYPLPSEVREGLHTKLDEYTARERSPFH